MTLRTLRELDFAALTQRTFFPSPAAWEDQVLYFLLLDRFSDGKEKDYLDHEGRPVTQGQTPRFQPGDRGNAASTPQDRQDWFEAGGRFVGGTLKGLESKLGYLKRLGVTAIWISPVFKQTAWSESYHGYGIQNFLDVDPHFGTREHLRDVVAAAHGLGIRVILDIILNHTGDVFDYTADRYEVRGADGRLAGYDPRWDGRPYAAAGFRDAAGRPTLPFGPVDLARHPQAWPEGAVWPAEFQAPETFSRLGRISNWDHDPEFREGDFLSLKDVCLGQGGADDYRPSAALRALCGVYKYWIAYADLDGFRVDTVKHMDPGASRFFTAVIHEFAQSLGKENFYLVGEITGGRQRAFETLETTGLNAALGIDDIPDKLEYLVKGWRDPREYFDLFRNSLLVQKESHVWFRNRIVTTFDDHDQVRKGQGKARFCHNEADGQDNGRLVLNALALLATTLGIPCIYYGTEQGFDGHGDNDRYLREAMFGGAFGPFVSRGRHCFDEAHPVYRELAKILALRREHLALRRGRQYLRPISGNGADFGLPSRWGEGPMHSVVAWSRIFCDQEMLCALNTDPGRAQRAWVTLDESLQAVGRELACLYSTDPGQIGGRAAVEARNGKAARLTLPAAGFAIWA